MATQTEPEQVEGLDDDQDTYLGRYPIDTYLIRNEQRTVHDVLRRIENGSYIMNPDFQRDFIWDPTKQSKLIESVLMRIPLPVFYLAENDKGNLIVVDGLQRLSTFNRFVNNELKLKLPDRSDLNRKMFKDLPPKLQNRIEDFNLIVYVIDHGIDDRALLDIFDRVNSGDPLTRQQMRNCLYMGEGTKFLTTESKTDIFLEATGKSLRTDKMRDREFINRFCAFQILNIKDYKDMDSFLCESLTVMNQQSSLTELSKQFRISLHNNFNLFGRHAFRKHTKKTEKRGLINASLWDVMSTGLSRYSQPLIVDRAQILKRSFYDLLDDERFDDSISRSTNNAKQVRYRFSATQKMLEEVLGAYQN